MHPVTRDDIQAVLAAPVGTGHYVSLSLSLTQEERSKRSDRIFLKKRVAQFEKLLADQPDQIAEFQASLKRVERWLDSDLKSQAQGVVLYCNHKAGWLRGFQLTVPVRNRLAWDEQPHIEPLAEVVEDHHHHCVVLFDSHHGRILSVYLDQVQKEEAYDHAVPRKVKVGGWSQMRYQRHHDERSYHFLKDLAEHLDEFVRREGPHDVSLVGQERQVAELRKLLSQAVIERLKFVEHVSPDAPVPQVLERLRPHIEREREQEKQDLLARLVERIRQDHLAVGGLEAVLPPLLEGRVDRLLLDPEREHGGLQCTQCGYLFADGAEDPCCYCRGALRTVNLGEAMVQVAEKHGVKIEFLARPNSDFGRKLGGVGAFLRF